MSTCDDLTRSPIRYDFVATGLFVGLAGGLAEIAVVWLYSALTGGDAAMVARHVAAAVGLAGAPAVAGIIVHIGLAVALGVALTGTLQTVVDRSAEGRATFCFMVCGLAVVWLINFFVVLPAISPGFVHLLPYAVTLASKLAFGFTAAATSRMLHRYPKFAGSGEVT
jgi:hypothetical protein